MLLKVLHFMAEASQKGDRYHHDILDQHMFILSAATAGELVNCFIGFLSGTSLPSAPPGAAERPWGAWWQQDRFGGPVKVYEKLGHRLGALQPGITWIVDEEDICQEIEGRVKRNPKSSGKVPCPSWLAGELVVLAVTDTTGQTMAFRLHTSRRGKLSTSSTVHI
jgi:hypothetical protein